MNAKHTIEPWAKVAAQRGFVITAKGGFYDIAVVRDIGNESNESNADRIVACVNACAGIEDPAELRRQRNELLEVVSLLHFRCMGEVPDERNLPALAKAAYENATKGTK